MGQDLFITRSDPDVPNGSIFGLNGSIFGLICKFRFKLEVNPDFDLAKKQGCCRNHSKKVKTSIRIQFLYNIFPFVLY